MRGIIRVPVPFCNGGRYPFLLITKRYNMKTKKKIIFFGAALLMMASFMFPVGCAEEEIPTEPEIPSHFTTYTEEGLFSISYPPEWETALSLIEDLEEYVKEVITSIDSDVPVEGFNIIFVAGLPIETGYMPNATVGVESMPGVVWTHDKVVEAQIKSIKMVSQDYQEFSRVKVNINGRETTILDYEADVPDIGRFHYLSSLTLVSKTCWMVTCTSFPDDFSGCKDDFNGIVRSLRILK
jgi:hypothetical protein